MSPHRRRRRAERGINYGDMPKVSRARFPNTSWDDDFDTSTSILDLERVTFATFHLSPTSSQEIIIDTWKVLGLIIYASVIFFPWKWNTTFFMTLNHLIPEPFSEIIFDFNNQARGERLSRLVERLRSVRGKLHVECPTKLLKDSLFSMRFFLVFRCRCCSRRVGGRRQHLHRRNNNLGASRCRSQ